MPQPPTTTKRLDHLRAYAGYKAQQYHAGAAWGTDGMAFVAERLSDELGEAMRLLQLAREALWVSHPHLSGQIREFLDREIEKPRTAFLLETEPELVPELVFVDQAQAQDQEEGPDAGARS